MSDPSQNADPKRLIPRPHPPEFLTKGEREVGRDVHYDRCLSPLCPCYQEGKDDALRRPIIDASPTASGEAV